MPTFRVFPDGSSSLSPSPNTHSSSYAATHGHGGTPRSQYPAFSGAYSDHRLSAGTHPNLISATFAPGAPSLAGMDAAPDTPHERPPVPPLPSDLAQSRKGWPAERSYLNIRDSYNTDASFSTDLSSIPIVEPSHGTVRHVMGIARAEVVRTPKPSMSSVHPSVHLNRLSGTKSTIGVIASEKPPPLPTSPLTKTGFTIEDREERRERDDPFRDVRTPSPIPPQAPPQPPPANRRSVAPSNATFGDTGEQRWPPLRTSRLPWARKHDSSGSAGTSHGTATASTPSTRSSFGIRWSKGSSALAPPRPTDVPYTPASYGGSPRSVAFPASAPHDTLTVPSTLDAPSSRTSVASATSSLAESLLASFPFVPPSPAASAHSVHTPPASPLGVPEIRGEERRESSATGASALSSTLGADSRAHTPSAPPSSRTASTPTPPPSASGTRRSSLTDSPKPLFLNRKVDRSRLSIDREAGASS
ncbi:hypothetical protein PsYK624_097140 [Phanerochaete sordida]|uniref:Uncharacterized protein n=1 Tax=Phanerochaete sordida TaxID=48140 RepID=A0A9P3GH20_9APHY|nr:hypothetical protein PsYK624_097140 [Phanerochaete sordida]